ncbi:spermatogenic leucine zipper protein 1 [Rattus rattus]|uniref:spermatogenic leucine zipper protein 1 n=1 Tax=Rattus rattus TaxID=10117 RepID=UPI0013F36839|nr:spermatogenic leucine zipper protein 1 [Rattus rattus]
MADSDSSSEMPPHSPSHSPIPCAKKPPNTGITISLLEIGSLPTFCCSSFSEPNNNMCPIRKQGKVQKFSNLLKDVKDVLKNIAGFEEKTTDGEPFDDTYIPEDLSELNIRGFDKRNKLRFKDDIFIHFDPERENPMRQEMLFKSHSAKNMVQKFARDLCNSEEKRGCDGMQLNAKRRRTGSVHIRGEYRKLRNNMEQLLQEADHWSKQHNELSELMRSYQECHKEIKDIVDCSRLYSQTQNNEVPSKQKLEEQVKKLSQDTHSLHLIAALLENECQILQQRVDILRELHLHDAGPGHEKPLQTSGEQDKKCGEQDKKCAEQDKKCAEQDKKCPKLAETEKMDSSKHTMKTTEGTITRKPKIFRCPNDCLTKKARNNRFNARVAKKSLVGKRRTISSFR